MLTCRTSQSPRVPESADVPAEKPKKASGIPEAQPASSEKGAAVPDAPKTTGDARQVLRPVKNWLDAVERLGRSAPMVASFVKAARAFTTEDGNVIVRFDNDFSMRMMEQDESRDQLRMALSAVLQREVGERELRFEVAAKKAAGSAIDEIIGEVTEDR